RDHIGGFGCPPEASISTTSEPESDDVMKKIATRMIAMTERIEPSGSPPRTSKRTRSETTPSSGSTRSPEPKSCLGRPVPPRTENQKKPTIEGTSRTPAMNSRTVRPREMRAMKTPTKGAQEIHQPQ